MYWAEFSVFFQEQVSESTTTLVLSKLLPDTMYTVTVLPVYAEGDGPQLSQKGKTSKWLQNDIRRFGQILSILSQLCCCLLRTFGQRQELAGNRSNYQHLERTLGAGRRQCAGIHHHLHCCRKPRSRSGENDFHECSRNGKQDCSFSCHSDTYFETCKWMFWTYDINDLFFHM